MRGNNIGTHITAFESTLNKAEEQIYSTVQLALRQYVGRFRLDELLEQKNDIAAFVLKNLQDVQGRLFVGFINAGLKDIILPGEIRDIMNTAKLLDENATLARLKELETLERIFDKVGSISVSSGNGLLAQLREIVGAK